MKDTIFREYDIRGIVGTELLIDQAYELGRAIAYYIKKYDPYFSTIAIGMDGRTHSESIKNELTKAFIASGINVIFLGICPTPAVYFSLFNLDVDGAIMITASHNGPKYNGMKLCIGPVVVWGDELQTIKTYYKEKKYIAEETKGTYTEYTIIALYVSWLAKQFSNLENIPINTVFDCGNGTGGTVIPLLAKALGWQNVEILFEEVDGRFPHHEADPTIPENMKELKKTVTQNNYAIGIGLDGDCDRMVPMTKQGTLVPGDQLLALFASNVIANHPGAGVVFDIKSSSGLIELLERWGAQPIMSPSGHSIIKDMMTKHMALLGGELSCHFFFKDNYFGYDDGIYAALRLLEILHASTKPLHEMLEIFPKKHSSREYRIQCPEELKKSIVSDISKKLASMPHVSVITIDGVRATFSYGWGIIRASNTQAALSMRFESDSAEGLKKVIHTCYELLRPYLDEKILQELYHA